MYSLTLDEVQYQLGDLGKPLSSMNLDELFKNVWTTDQANQSMCVEMEGTMFRMKVSYNAICSLHLLVMILTQKDNHCIVLSVLYLLNFNSKSLNKG